MVGVFFTASLAIGILITPQPDLLEALFGNINNVTLLYTVAGVIFSIAAVFLTRAIYHKLVLSMISEDLATSKGINVAKNNLLYILLVSLIVAIGITIVGTLLVGFLVIVPAAAAKNMSNSLSRYSRLSAVFGAISTLVGIAISTYLDIQPGPVVVFAGVGIFVATILIKWRTK